MKQAPSGRSECNFTATLDQMSAFLLADSYLQGIIGSVGQRVACLAILDACSRTNCW